jgi:hypothetical protein
LRSCRAPQETERLCVFLMDKALVEMKARGADAAAHVQKRCFETSLCSQAEGRAQTILTVFDLRGFKCAPRDGLEARKHVSERCPQRRSTSNADIPFIRFFIKCGRGTCTCLLRMA